MREVKFRAWDGIRMTTSGIMFNTSNGCLEVPTTLSFNPSSENKELFKLMQYTGLKDKNGKELYIDDIVKLNIPSLSDKFFIVTHDDFGIPCFFLVGSFAECIDFKQYFLEMNSNKNDFEIIGNIYENPELLK